MTNLVESDCGCKVTRNDMSALHVHPCDRHKSDKQFKKLLLDIAQQRKYPTVPLRRQDNE